MVDVVHSNADHFFRIRDRRLEPNIGTRNFRSTFGQHTAQKYLYLLLFLLTSIGATGAHAQIDKGTQRFLVQSDSLGAFFDYESDVWHAWPRLLRAFRTRLLAFSIASAPCSRNVRISTGMVGSAACKSTTLPPSPSSAPSFTDPSCSNRMSLNPLRERFSAMVSKNRERRRAGTNKLATPYRSIDVMSVGRHVRRHVTLR